MDIYVAVMRVIYHRAIEEKVNKSMWGMPRHSEAKKDVVSCDKLRVGANNH
jgi:hypothetical protein